ncbi:MAG: hypothetical protein UV67_C0015G0045 [Parcubacteria group bacterium GW2011_GWC1_43_12]|nr:MAG: hypothetical protein UV67_C0015G0045 [Parcubacteria group bacterium GW2011_GWC1_43_12]
MDRSIKIFIAIILGAFIGASIALWINQAWWMGFVGMVIGGSIGYLAYGFGNVIEAIKSGWNYAIAFEINKTSWWSIIPSRIVIKEIFLISLIIWNFAFGFFISFSDYRFSDCRFG